MALFERNQLPHRSTLSRFLAALDQSTVEALRTSFQEDVLARKPFPSLGGLIDRTGRLWVVTDVDGTRQAARPRFPLRAFTASDVLDLYLHRGSFETVLADEDDEQDADRWYSHTPCGQEFAQIWAQWIWNLHLELGQALSPSELRPTEFAPPSAVEPRHACEIAEPAVPVEYSALNTSMSAAYGPPQFAHLSFTHGFPGSAFTPAARWHTALPRQPSPASPGTAS